MDITAWAAYGFGESHRVHLKLPRYRVTTPHPLAFGSPQEVDKWQTRNMIGWLAMQFNTELAPDTIAVLWRPDRRHRAK